jgi:hypothetical protein
MLPALIIGLGPIFMITYALIVELGLIFMITYQIVRFRNTLVWMEW